MSTDHRGRPLQSQGGAIPHLNRPLYHPEYGELYRPTADEEHDDIRALMEDSGTVGRQGTTSHHIYQSYDEPEPQTSWNAGNGSRARSMKDL